MLYYTPSAGIIRSGLTGMISACFHKHPGFYSKRQNEFAVYYIFAYLSSTTQPYSSGILPH